jgi:hypothetical protein
VLESSRLALVGRLPPDRAEALDGEELPDDPEALQRVEVAAFRGLDKSAATVAPAARAFAAGRLLPGPLADPLALPA